MDVKRHKRPTLKDIAQASKLSVSTVSEILNGKEKNFSSEETRRLVFKIASDIGYRPNFGYKIMLGKRTKTVAIVSSARQVSTDAHIKSLLLSLTEKFEAKGYASYICTLSQDAEGNIAHMQELISRGVEHFVMIGTPVGHAQMQELFKREFRTCVGYGSLFERNVSTDIAQGVERLLRFFLEDGRGNFKMIIADPSKGDNGKVRLMALESVFPDLDDRALFERYVVAFEGMDGMEGDFEMQAFLMGYKMTAAVLARDPGVKALFYQNDYFAVGGAKCLVDRGVSIGRDIAVAGVNNIHAVKFHPFPISSVEHGVEGIAEALVNEAFGEEPLQCRLEAKVFIRKAMPL